MTAPDIENAIEKVETRQADPDFAEGDIKASLQRNGDLALRVYELDVTEDELARVDPKKLLRKIDLHLIPIVRCFSKSMLLFAMFI